jgi:hypothetical protein
LLFRDVVLALIVLLCLVGLWVIKIKDLFSEGTRCQRLEPSGKVSYAPWLTQYAPWAAFFRRFARLLTRFAKCASLRVFIRLRFCAAR